MTKQEVVQKINENNGSWIAPHQIVFTQEKGDKTIHAKSADGMSGFLIGIKNDWKEFHVTSSFYFFEGERMGEFIRFRKNLGEILGIPFEIPGAEKIETTVKIKDEKSEGILMGKVEAYEKIITDRPITIG